MTNGIIKKYFKKFHKLMKFPRIQKVIKTFIK